MIKNKKISQLNFVEQLSQIQLKDLDHSLLIYDQKLKNKYSAFINKFPYQYSVRSGEELKNIDSFPNHIKKISKLTEKIPNKKMIFISFGGGSVGDFVGFIASVYKRGVRLVHIPSTWLAAIDSSHGGKTALNVENVKNQIGTFYPAEGIYLCHEVLSKLPLDRVYEAYGELLKISLIEGGQLWKKIKATKELSSELLWKNLPRAIQAKMKIVNADPLEESGIRQILNLGHTMGHVFESYFQIPHGVAVNYGLCFAIRWSLHKGYLSAPISIPYILDPRIDDLMKIPKKELKNLLLKDKKRDVDLSLKFVFFREPGTVFLETVTVDDLVSEYIRQGRNV